MDKRYMQYRRGIGTILFILLIAFAIKGSWEMFTIILLLDQIENAIYHLK